MAVGEALVATGVIAAGVYCIGTQCLGDLHWPWDDRPMDPPVPDTVCPIAKVGEKSKKLTCDCICFTPDGRGVARDRITLSRLGARQRPMGSASPFAKIKAIWVDAAKSDG